MIFIDDVDRKNFRGRLSILVPETQTKGRGNIQVAAKNLLCCWTVRELGPAATEFTKRFGITQPAVTYAVSRGERIAQERNYNLVL